MKKIHALVLGIVIIYGRALYASDHHPFITRLCAQIESQLKAYDKAVAKLKSEISDKKIPVSDSEAVLSYLMQAQDTIAKALNPPEKLQKKRWFLLPTYLETAFDRTIDRWSSKRMPIPPDSEFKLISRYATSLVQVLTYLRNTDKKSLEESLRDSKSVYLALFSDCVVDSIVLSLYTLKTKKHLDKILQRLYLLNGLLEEYSKSSSLLSKEEAERKAIASYSDWTKEVIERITNSEISLKNPQKEEVWRPKVQPTAIRAVSSLGRKTMLDRVVGYMANQVTRLSITKPCSDYISLLLRFVRECGNEVPL